MPRRNETTRGHELALAKKGFKFLRSETETGGVGVFSVPWKHQHSVRARATFALRPGLLVNGVW